VQELPSPRNWHAPSSWQVDAFTNPEFIKSPARVFFLIIFFQDFIYLFILEIVSERRREREGEKQKERDKLTRAEHGDPCGARCQDPEIMT